MNPCTSSLTVIGIDQRTVVDSAAAANHQLVGKDAGLPGKADARFEILLVNRAPGFVLASVAARALAGKDQRAQRLGQRSTDGCLVDECGIPDCGVAVRFAARCVVAPAQADIRRQVRLDLPCVPAEDRPVVGDPAWGMQVVEVPRCPRLADQEGAEGVPVLSPEVFIRGRLVMPELEATGVALAGAADFADPRILVILALATEREAVRAVLPVHDVAERDHIVGVRRVFLLTQLWEGVGHKLENWKVVAKAVGDAQLLVPSCSQLRCLGFVDVVGAVAAHSQRID